MRTASSRLLVAAVIAGALALPASASANAGDSAVAHKVTGNGPFRPAADCGAWSHYYYPTARMRACAWHFGHHVRSGLQFTYEHGSAFTNYLRWYDAARRYGGTKVSHYATHQINQPSPDFWIPDVLQTVWVDYSGPGASTCIHASGYMGGTRRSPWQHGYDNNKRCP